MLEYQKLNNIQIRIDNEFLTSINQLTPQYSIDPYFQKFIPFKHALNCIFDSKLSLIPPSSLDFYFSSGLYRPTHIAAFKGEKNTLKKWFEAESLLTIRADAYGKSPLFYSIMSKHQECTQIIMEYIISLRSPQKSVLENSLHSVRNDFSIIIKNSSNLLQDFINKIFLTTDYNMVPETENFPQMILQSIYNPTIEKFDLPENKRLMPAVIKFSAFAIDSVHYSNGNISLLESIKECTNNKIFDCFFIKEYIDYNWSGVIGWVIFLSALQFFTIIVFIATLIVGNSNFYLLLVFSLIYFMIFVWEVLQIVSMGFYNYFSDIWNWLDTLTPIIVIYWILAIKLKINTEYETCLLAVMLMMRGLTAFKSSNGIRYYVRLILASLDSIKYFLVLFFYSTFFFSIVIAIAQNENFNFETLWNQSWEINFGGEINMNKGNTVLVYITVVVARIVNVVLMLNMLISILGDSYDNFLLEKHIIDYREKLDSVIEIQKMMFFKRASGSKQFFNFLVSAYEDINLGGEWQGKILYIEKKQEKKIQELGEKIVDFESKNKKILDRVSRDIAETEKKININISGVENKIIAKIDKNVSEIENKILGVENKVSNIESKMNQVDTDLKRIIQILLKDKIPNS